MSTDAVRKSPSVPVRPTAGVRSPEPRLTSLDALRGCIMLLMASASFGLPQLVAQGKLERAGTAPDSFEARVVTFAAGQLEHVTWQGGVLWDLIQPAFMFMVGAALPYSYARRVLRGDSYLQRLGHAWFRAAALVVLGVVFSTKAGDRQTNFVFTNVLAQIGLGYPLLFFFVGRKPWLQLAGCAAILAGTWYAFFQHPLPPEGFDYATVGIQADDPHRADLVPEGLRRHWAAHTNFAEQSDRTILNWFPRETPFTYNPQGYATLNFVPAIVTMLLGLMAGELLRSSKSDGEKLRMLLIAGAVCAVLGAAAGYTICPIVKRIWTPSWTLVSGGCMLWLLTAFYFVFDVRGWRRTAWPLAVVGMNSLVIYAMSMWLRPWTAELLKRHFGMPYRHAVTRLNEYAGAAWNPELFGGLYGPVLQNAAVLFCFWLVCVWLRAQKIIVRL